MSDSENQSKDLIEYRHVEYLRYFHYSEYLLGSLANIGKI